MAAAVALFIVGMLLGWALGRRDLVQELESLDGESVQ